MDKVSLFLKKPRNVYYSIIVMLTLVVGLMTVSFSYYIDDSTNDTKLVSLAKVNNIIQSDALNDNIVVVLPDQEVTFTMYVMSNNNFDSLYKLFYKCKNKLVSVKVDKEVENRISSYDVHKYDITVKNNATTIQEVEFGIANGYLDKAIIMDDDAYEIK